MQSIQEWVAEQIADYRKQTEEQQYTDVGDVWEVLDAIERQCRAEAGKPKLEPMELHIIVEGGLVQEVCSPTPGKYPLKVTRIDYDVEYAELDELSPVKQATGRYEDALVEEFAIVQSLILLDK